MKDITTPKNIKIEAIFMHFARLSFAIEFLSVETAMSDNLLSKNSESVGGFFPKVLISFWGENIPS